MTRERATASIAAAAERRRARLATLGFADLAAYLEDRCVGKGWSLRQVRAELQVRSSRGAFIRDR